MKVGFNPTLHGLPESDNGNQNQSSHRKRRRARRKAIMKQLWSDYTQNTSLHCLKYTTEKKFHWAERIFWMITFTLSFGMCVWLIHNVWIKWQTSPVIVSFSEKIVPVEMLPFPSITICPQIKAKASVYNYTHHFKSYFSDLWGGNMESTSNSSDSPDSGIHSPEEIKKFEDISLICSLSYYMDLSESYTHDGPNVTNTSTIDHILSVSPDLEYFEECYWLGVKKECYELFTKVLTEEGVCFNFNGLAADEIFRTDKVQTEYNYSNIKQHSSGWDLNIGYNNSDDVDYLQQYPYRGQFSKHRPYLEVIFSTPKEDYDSTCNGLNKGFKVYTQNPASHPQSSIYSYAILPGQLSALALTINMINTSEKLINYDSDVRQCFFSTEKYLRFFKLYTASNCMLECMSNYTFKMCECVSFHMPHYDSRSICTMQRAPCLAEAAASNRKLMEYIEECDCLPSCNSLTYKAEILKSEYNLGKSIANLYKLGGVDVDEIISSNEYSKLEVYYRESGFVTITRSELFGVTDFLANIGGLLGLFMGFSFLSLVEIVYFFSIRLGFTFGRDLRNERKVTNTQVDPEPTNVENEMLGAAKVKHI